MALKPVLAKEIYAAAFTKLVKDFGTLMKMVAIPYAAVVALWFVPKPEPIYEYGAMLLEWVAYTYVAVSVIRYAILGPESVTPLGVGQLGLRELRFFIFFAVIFLCAQILLGLTTLSLTLFPGLAGWELALAIPIGIAVLSRFLLVFAAVALDRDLSLLQSFKITRFHWLSVVLVGALIAASMLIPSYLLFLVPEYYTLPLYMAISVIGFVYGSIGVAYLNEALTRRYRAR